MRYLYLLLLFSLGALLWAAFSIARHIRRHARQQALLSSVEEHKFEKPGLEKSVEPAIPVSASTQDESANQTQSTNGSHQ